MDITVKEYEHQHLAMSVCKHECNVGGKYVVPQAQAFGLSWTRAMAGLADTQSCSWGRTEKEPRVATGWQSPLDPTDKQTIVKDLIVVPALALQLVWGSGRHEMPPAEQDTHYKKYVNQ